MRSSTAVHAKDATIIVTNYRRPWNIPKILKECMQLSELADVIIIDNSPENPISRSLDLPLDGLDYRWTGKNLGAGHRFAISALLDKKVIVCLDDDIFLSSVQIQELLRRWENDKERLHGVWGQEVSISNGRPWLKGGLHGVDREVDIINRIYVFSPSIAYRALELASKLGYESWNEIGPIDDILLSYAGAKKPICHFLGPLEECSTSNSPDIAVWRLPGFQSIRSETVKAIQMLVNS